MKTAFLFPGQGAQAIGMGQDLATKLPAAAALFEQASGILGYDLLEICKNGPSEKLNATDVSQPAIFVSSLAALEHLKQTEPAVAESVVATAGLSLGEYTALVYAGVMTFEDGLRVVKARGEAMQSAAVATPSGMVAVIGPELTEVQSLVQEARGSQTLEIANILCPGNTVVSGTLPALDELCRLADERKLRTARLAVAGAFHTLLMKPADEKLATALQPVDLKTARIQVWSNVDATPHTEASDFRDLLVKQILSPVRWEDTMRGLLAAGVERWYEIGPGRVLAGLLKRIHRKAEIANIAA